MEIRPMTMADYDDVHRLWSNTAGMGLNAYDDSWEGIARFLARNPNTALVAVEEGEIAGTILCGHDGRRGHIYHLAIEEKYRRRGVGRELLRRSLAGLEKEGVKKTSLVVFRENGAGNTFWEAEGFAARADIVYRDKRI